MFEQIILKSKTQSYKVEVIGDISFGGFLIRQWSQQDEFKDIRKMGML